MDKWKKMREMMEDEPKLTEEQKNALVLLQSLKTRREALTYLQRAKTLCATQLEYLHLLLHKLEIEKRRSKH